MSKDLKEVEEKPHGYVGPLTSGWQVGVTVEAAWACTIRCVEF